MLIDQFISYIEAEKRFSPLTVEAYQSDMDQFAHFLKDVTAALFLSGKSSGAVNYMDLIMEPLRLAVM